MKVKINNKIWDLKEAKTEEERKQGLLDINKLEENKGMIFIYDKPLSVSFWMKDTKIPLDIIFIDEDYEIFAIHKGKPMSEDSIKESNVSYVIEVNENSNIKVGDYIDILDEEENLPTMKILAPDGSTLMELMGGERIVSRRETKILIKKAKKAFESKNDKDYKSLGKYIFKVFKNQDNREPEYVNSPNN